MAKERSGQGDLAGWAMTLPALEKERNEVSNLIVELGIAARTWHVQQQYDRKRIIHVLDE